MFDTFCGAALLLQDYYRIILICNMAGVADWVGHAYHSGAHGVTPGVLLQLFLCDILISLSSVFICNLFYSVRYIVYVYSLCFTCSRLDFWRIWIISLLTFGICFADILQHTSFERRIFGILENRLLYFKVFRHSLCD